MNPAPTEPDHKQTMWANGWRGKTELVRDEVVTDAVVAVAIGVCHVGEH